MALNSTRWLMMAALGCSLLATGLVTYRTRVVDRVIDSAEVLHLRRIQRRTMEAAQGLRSRARADSVIATLPVSSARDFVSPSVVVDPLLPQTHRLIAERTVERQWRRLHIDSAIVPVTVAVVLDTAVVPAGSPNSRRGEIAFDYALATREGTAVPERCVVIIAVQMHQIARPSGHRTLAARMDPARNGEAVLGPCAFQARFGVAGAEIDAWLRARSYDLAFGPSWEEPERDGAPRIPRELEGYSPAEVWAMVQRHLSPDAQACAAGAVDRCDASLRVPEGMRQLPRGGLVTRRQWDQQWSGLTPRYLSDLVTRIGPDRFARFWRSDLAPDAALRAAAGMPVSVWTNQWAMSLVGEARTGPGLTQRELLGAALLAAICLAITVWGWGRRQVR